MDGQPTTSHPVPTLFPRNNFQRPLKERSRNAIEKRDSLNATLDYKTHSSLPSALSLVNPPPVASNVLIATGVEGNMSVLFVCLIFT